METEKQDKRYADFLTYNHFVIFSMWNIMQVHLGDSFGFRRELEERGQTPSLQWCDINVEQFIYILKDFCDIIETRATLSAFDQMNCF
jgi:hypothetical protein